MSRVWRPWLPFAAPLALFSPAIVTTGVHAPVPRFERGECPVNAGEFAGTVRLECGNLVVYRVRERPADGTLKIAVAIVHPLSPVSGPPVVVPHGGPGGPGGLRGGEMGGALRAAPLAKRDFVVYDQRGAGLSEPSLCPESRANLAAVRNGSLEAGRQAYIDAARACSTSLRARGFDPATFSTVTNAADLIDLRTTLGYAQWDVFGVSYGARLAQEAMRRDPGGVRRVALSSPVIPGPAQQAESPLAFQRVMDHVFASCAAQPSCASAFPTLAQDFDSLFAELNAKPFDVRFETATETTSVHFTGERMIRALHNGFARRVNRVPLYISELRRGDRERAARALLGFAAVAANDGTLTTLVGCFESGGPGPYAEALKSVGAQLRPPFRVLLNDLEECPYFQSRFARPADRAFVESAIPTLIMTQEYDDRTPTSYGQRIAAHLKHAHLIELPALAHGQPNSCELTILLSFISDAGRGPDTSCVASMPPLQFETKNLERVTMTLSIATKGGPSALAGNWEASFPDAPVLYKVDLAIDSVQLTGQIVTPAQSFPLFDGRVSDNTLTFRVKSGDGVRTITFKGRVAGDTITFTRDVDVPPGANPGGAGLFGASGPHTFTATRTR